jgi:PAS domain S-box-containing protein
MRILIADDHELVRRGVRSVLLNQPGLEICGEASDGQEAIERARELKPDLIIMDISMPKLNGLEATREVRRVLPQTDVLVLSQHDSTEMMRQALNAGARGYVIKSAISADLIAGIEKVREGRLFFDAALSGKKGANMDVQEILQRSVALESALRDSEERFRLTFEQAAVGIAHVAEDGRWLRVNQKLCEIVGYSQEELRKLTFQDITHPADLAADVEQARKVITGELDHYSMEKRYIRKDGSLVWINLTVGAVRDSDRRLKYFIAVVEDIGERKAAGEKLLETKRDLQAFAAHLELVTNTMTVAVTRCSRDFRYLWVNQRYAEWLGRPAEQIIGHHIEEVLGPEAFAQVRPYFERVLAGESVSYEQEVDYREIGKRWIYAAYTPTFGLGKTADGWVAVVLDITERKRAEEGVRESEQRQRTLAQHQTAVIDNMAGGLYTLDEQGMVTSINSAAEEMFGWTKEELLGKRMHDVTHYKHPDGSPYRASECTGLKALQNGEPILEQEDVFIRKDGSFMPVVFTASPLRREGKIAGVVVSFRQDAGRRRTTLVENERWLRELIEALPAAIYTTDAEGRVTHFNRAAVELCGREPKLGTDRWCVSWKMFWPDGTPLPHDQCPMAIALKEGRAVDGAELILERPDGTRRWCVPYPRPLRGAQGELVGGINLLIDITDRKESEEASRESEARLRALTERLDSEVRARTRELEELNADVLRQSEQLRELSWRLLHAQDEERRHIARELHDSAGQMLAALGMNLSRILRTIKRKAPEMEEPAEEAQEVLQQLTKEIRTMSYLLHPPLLEESGLDAALCWYIRGLIDRSGMDISLNIPEDFGRLPRDMELLVFRLVQESLTNIHRHSGSKTAVIQVVQGSHTLLVEVRDQGRGIPQEKLAEIQSGGSGVGIRGMRERLLQFRGKLTIESSSTGTTIRFTIPLAKETAVQSTAV